MNGYKMCGPLAEFSYIHFEELVYKGHRLISENNVANFYQDVPHMQNLKQNGVKRFMSAR